MSDPSPSSTNTISGIDVMRGVGAKPAKSFWADAWDRVLLRWSARIGIGWIAVIAFFAVFAPVLANGLPLWTTEFQMNPDGSRGDVLAEWSPLWRGLGAVDLMLLIGAIVGVPWIAMPVSVLRLKRSHRLGILCAAVLQAGFSVVIAGWVADWLTAPNAEPDIRAFVIENASAVPWLIGGGISLILAILCVFLPTFRGMAARVALVAVIGGVSTLVIVDRFDPPRANYDRFIDLELKGQYQSVYTVIPWSPTQARTNFYVLPPGTIVDSEEPDAVDTSFGARTFVLGTDSVGQDVLSQMMHACRLSISIGLVSTGISVLIGIVIGSLMGYFGGWVDLLLSRIVEIFMAIPVLFLLIVAAAVLPRNTYMMMAIIGLVSWTLSARFIRAEFLKMRSQDFVQGAIAAGLPLRLVLFRHMLPNGITPVLVLASFSIAAAILAEATLSFLGLGPDGQASWGKLLASATGATGTFNWWLAIFPGAAIFLTVLAYNLMGEAFRDAIDPKLRKAAH